METAVYYTVTQASQVLSVHPQTVRRWIKSGRLRALRVGQTLRIPREVVDMPTTARTAFEDDGFEALSLAGLNDVWDNAEDAVYDEWEKHYGLRAR